MATACSELLAKDIKSKSLMTLQAEEKKEPYATAIGNFGKWQLRIYCLISLSKFTLVSPMVGIVFMAPPIAFQCMDQVPDAGNLDASEYDSVCVTNCSHYEYDRSIFTETIVSQFNLICDRQWLRSFSQTVVMMGMLFGCPLGGFLADRYGRKWPLIISIAVQLISGSGISFSKYIIQFLCLRFISGVMTGAILSIGYVYIIEIIGPKYREMIVCLFALKFSFFHMSMAAIGYYFRSWHVFQLVMTLPGIVLLSYIFLIPESPRWLITVRREEEAVNIMQKAATCNKLLSDAVVTSVNKMSEKIQKYKYEDEKINYLDIFKHPELGKISICIAILWCINGLCYYGSIQYLGVLDGNIFINVALAGAAQIPGNLLGAFAIKLLGRKTTAMVSNIITGFCFLTIALIRDTSSWYTVVLSAIGILLTSLIFSDLFIYTTELFPTVARNMGVGFGSMAARVGAMIAPFVVNSSANQLLTPLTLGILPLVAAATNLFLKETKGRKMIDKLAELEK